MELAKVIKILTFFSFFIFILFLILNIVFCDKFTLAITITAGTFFYHFVMRLIVGTIIDIIMQNKADYNKKWFFVGEKEKRLYNFLNVKKWKIKNLSYQPDLFDKSKHTWEEIAQAMCQAEIVHEIIILLSFLPLIASFFFGDFFVFLITSVLSAAFDLSFVILQRYNRPRILRIINKKQKT